MYFFLLEKAFLEKHFFLQVGNHFASSKSFLNIKIYKKDFSYANLSKSQSNHIAKTSGCLLSFRSSSCHITTFDECWGNV